MREITRSGVNCYAKCPRYYYYTFHAGPEKTGLDSKTFAMELVVGIAVHEGLEHFLRCPEELEEAVQKALSSYDEGVNGKLPEGEDQWTMEALAYWKGEQRALVEALVRGWVRAVWPSFSQKYRVLSVEEEARTWLSEDIPLRSRWDYVVEDRITEELYLGNFKTAQDFRDWPAKWHWDIQLWTESIAAEQKFSKRVTGCLMSGLKKGTRKENVLYCPLIYGYRKKEEDGSFSYSYETERKKGWERFPVWKSLSVREWIEGMPEEQLTAQFLTTDPIPKDDEMVAHWLKQVVRLERDINRFLEEDVTEEERLEYFRQNFSAVNCKKCRFADLCRGVSLEAAMAEGKFTARVEHHSPLLED